MSRPASTAHLPRPWYLDALCALAFWALGLAVGKRIGGALGIFGGAFFLLITLGMGYWFARSSWRTLSHAKQMPGPK